MYLLDSTWLPFQNLMLRHVYTVLLICSDYDRFMLEEDGRVEEELYKEYTELGLSTPPKITHTNSEEQALQLLETFKYDLVITMLDLGTDRVEGLAKAVKDIHKDMPVIALSPSPDHRKVRELKGENCPYIDYLFYWQGNPDIFLAMIKLVEDKMNIDHDTDEADVQVIIFVEDSVRFISTYLPQMYKALIHQTRISILEALNEWGKMLRMRGRPKVVLARTYDEAVELYNDYKENLLGVITDVSFPAPFGREEAGLKLASYVHTHTPEIPILVQSTDKKHEIPARALGADFIWKGSDTMLLELEEHFVKEYNFGPFLFKDPKSGEVIASAKTMKELQKALETIPIDSFVYHSQRNDFSKWLRSQSMYRLASLIKPIKLANYGTPEEARKLLYTMIRSYRAERTRGSIAEFSRANYDETLFFSRIGKGSLGGKGRGLAFVAMEMKANEIQNKYPEVYLSIPRTVVITTELFDKFLRLNKLEGLEFTDKSDNDILALFLASKLPEELEEDIECILKIIKVPISVRSSSLLEDSHFQPFAGVYNTCMIPNNGDDEKRKAELEAAIKTVWASTYSDCAQEYMRRTGHSLEEEKMAVIIQQVTGSAHGDMWFPNISGVARSLNYYPTSGMRTEDGVGMLSFGFGKIIVDEGTAFRFCPAKPRKPCNTLLSSEGSDQKTFYALDTSKPFKPLSDTDNLVSLPIEWAAEYPKSMRGIASTIDKDTGMLTESVRAEGYKLITFNGVLKYDTLPLARIVDDVLKLGSASMNEPVEIEFAVNIERDPEKKPDFSILQIRPISGSAQFLDITITDEERENAIVSSNKVMGNGFAEEIRDIVSIKPETFDPKEMREMALELEAINKSALSLYVLIATGRLGSSDPWLGIPCTWSQISKAHVIVEMGLKEFQVEPSEGTHFFQNMTSLGCLYLTVNPAFNDGTFCYDKLKNLEIVEETKHFIHVRAKDNLIIKANGKTGKAIILEDKQNGAK